MSTAYSSGSLVLPAILPSTVELDAWPAQPSQARELAAPTITITIHCMRCQRRRSPLAGQLLATLMLKDALSPRMRLQVLIIHGWHDRVVPGAPRGRASQNSQRLAEKLHRLCSKVLGNKP